MRIEAIFFANYARLDQSLLNAEGAGWEHFTLPLMPYPVAGYVAGILALDESEHGDLCEVGLVIDDEDGHVEPFHASTIAIGTRPKTVEGVPIRAPFAIPFMTVVREPTVMKARLEKDGVDIGDISCAVVGVTPDAPPADLE